MKQAVTLEFESGTRVLTTDTDGDLLTISGTHFKRLADGRFHEIVPGRRSVAPPKPECSVEGCRLAADHAGPSGIAQQEEHEPPFRKEWIARDMVFLDGRVASLRVRASAKSFTWQGAHWHLNKDGRFYEEAKTPRCYDAGERAFTLYCKFVGGPHFYIKAIEESWQEKPVEQKERWARFEFEVERKVYR